ncbi:hypothetical protein LINPERPRIM_LOCUS38667 [Linum perenne]
MGKSHILGLRQRLLDHRSKLRSLHSPLLRLRPRQFLHLPHIHPCRFTPWLLSLHRHRPPPKARRHHPHSHP